MAAAVSERPRVGVSRFHSRNFLVCGEGCGVPLFLPVVPRQLASLSLRSTDESGLAGVDAAGHCQPHRDLHSRTVARRWFEMIVKRPDLSFLKKIFFYDLIKGLLLTFS